MPMLWHSASAFFAWARAAWYPSQYFRLSQNAATGNVDETFRPGKLSSVRLGRSLPLETALSTYLVCCFRTLRSTAGVGDRRSGRLRAVPASVPAEVMLLKHLIFLLALAHLTLGAYQIVKVSNLQSGGQVRNGSNFPARFPGLHRPLMLTCLVQKSSSLHLDLQGSAFGEVHPAGKLHAGQFVANSSIARSEVVLAILAMITDSIWLLFASYTALHCFSRREHWRTLWR